MAIKKLNGNDYIVFVDSTTPEGSTPSAWRPIFCSTTNSLNITRETITIEDKCSAGQGFSTNLSGTGSWTISGSGNAIDESMESSADSYQELATIAKSGAGCWVKIANQDPGKGTAVVRWGWAVLTDYTETQDTNTPFTFDFTFTGSGDLTIVSTT